MKLASPGGPRSGVSLPQDRRRVEAENRRSTKNDIQIPQLTRDSRVYALKELARRAGVSRSFFRSWRIDHQADSTLVVLDPVSRAMVKFPNQAESNLSCSSSIAGAVSRAGWMAAGRRAPFPDLVVPFCKTEDDPGKPLFSLGSEGASCRLDILTSIVFTLMRVEETLSTSQDEHGRFPAAASLGDQEGFLERPIVDELGIAFEEAISSLLPMWRPEPRLLRMKLTHDIDSVGIPFDLRSTVAHAAKRRSLRSSGQDLAALVSDREPAELGLVRQLAKISDERRIRSAFYWKSAPAGSHDSGYDPKHPKIQRVIREIRDSGHELGVHPGYHTFRDRAALTTEISSLRQALGVAEPGGRQHYLRWSPETWKDWEACGLPYDSSVGFAERLGFRAGTAVPYRPWDFTEDRELDLFELPLILMDCTPVKYMRLSREEGLRRIKSLVETVSATGGVFTLLWHNSPLLDPDYRGWYEAILDLLEGAVPFEMPDRPAHLW